MLVLRAGLVRAANLAYSNISLTLIMFIVFTVYTARGGELTPKRVFTSLSLIAILRVSTVHFMGYTVIALMEGRVVLVRLQVWIVHACMHWCRKQTALF